MSSLEVITIPVLERSGFALLGESLLKGPASRLQFLGASRSESVFKGETLVKTQAIRWILAGNLMISTALAAEPLSDLKMRLAGLHSDEPLKIHVDVELKHRGTAPLHLNDERKRGAAIVEYGSRGVESIEQWWTGRAIRISVWKRGDGESEMPLINDVDAGDLIDPASLIDLLLDGATLLGDEPAAWQGQPARLLTIHPGPLTAERMPAEGESQLLNLGMKVWISESGEPLALERSIELQLGPFLTVKQRQDLTFQQVDGRLLVAEARETYSGTGLAVLHGRDDKKSKVTVLK